MTLPPDCSAGNQENCYEILHWYFTMSSARGPLYAGASKIDITPQDLTGLTNLFKRPFEGVHDPIYLRALVVDNGIQTAAIVAADLVEFGDTRAVRERIELQVGIPADHIIITASHDHNAPRVGKITPGATAQVGGPATDEYSDFVYDRVIEVVQQAKASLQPARVGTSRGYADVNTNRDVYTPQGWKVGVNPDGPSDKTVWVVKFENLAGEPIAILMNYAVHAVVLGPENYLVTGDLPGAAERYVEQFYQDGVVALWTMGAAGDQNPKYTSWDTSFVNGAKENGAGYVLADAQGAIVGAEVIRAVGQIQTMASEVRIAAEQRVITCPASAPRRDGTKVQQVDALDLLLGLILIDQVAITAVSGEVVNNIYQHLKRVSPLTNTLMITIANDRLGYIVDEAGYDTPTFATMATPLERGHAEAAIVNGLLELMSHYS